MAMCLTVFTCSSPPNATWSLDFASTFVEAGNIGKRDRVNKQAPLESSSIRPPKKEYKLHPTVPTLPIRNHTSPNINTSKSIQNKTS